ncbi:regulator of aidB expression [Escherichia coli]|nr:regulator of aidB expression [Escherichia coli]
MPVLQWGMLCVLSLLLSIGFLAVHLPAALLLGPMIAGIIFREGANKRGNSSRLTQSFHFFMFEPIFSPVNALNQPI